MGRIIRDIKDLILGEDHDMVDSDALHLWDEVDGYVAGGTNWSSELADGWSSDLFVGVTGPDLPDYEVPF